MRSGLSCRGLFGGLVGVYPNIREAKKPVLVILCLQETWLIPEFPTNRTTIRDKALGSP